MESQRLWKLSWQYQFVTIDGRIVAIDHSGKFARHCLDAPWACTGMNDLHEIFMAVRTAGQSLGEPNVQRFLDRFFGDAVSAHPKVAGIVIDNVHQAGAQAAGLFKSNTSGMPVYTSSVQTVVVEE